MELEALIYQALGECAPRTIERTLPEIDPVNSELDRLNDASAIQQAHDVYILHHLTCRVCIAGGQGRGKRCEKGAGLWAAYQSNAKE